MIPHVVAHIILLNSIVASREHPYTSDRKKNQRLSAVFACVFRCDADPVVECFHLIPRPSAEAKRPAVFILAKEVGPATWRQLGHGGVL